MDFITAFHSSVETSIKNTNDKLDQKMDIIDKEMKDINKRLDKHEEEEHNVQGRMEQRLILLEAKMKKSDFNKEHRAKVRKKEL